MGAYLANLEARVESNGAETEYSYSYATQEAEEKGEWTSVPGGSGKVTVAEDFAEPEARLTGVTANTTYYVRLTASNEKDLPPAKPVEAVTSFETSPAYPAEVDTLLPTDVAGTSAYFEGGFNPRSSETHWRFEYATSQAGPGARVRRASPRLQKPANSIGKSKGPSRAWPPKRPTTCGCSPKTDMAAWNLRL